MDAAPWPDHVLYASHDKRTFLVDIPRSLADAQEFGDETAKRTLRSKLSVAVPYQSNEPKSDKARLKLSNHGDFDDVHSAYQVICRQSLQQIRDATADAPYCFPRRLFVADDVAEPTPDSCPDEHDPTNVLKSLVNVSSLDSSSPAPSIFSVMMQDAQKSSWTLTGSIPYAQEVPDWGRALGAGPLTTSSNIEMKSPGEEETHRLRVPPNSCFVAGPCNLFHGVQLFRRVAQRYTPSSTFDMIYMDPPWPNRSAKRKGADGYRIEQSMSAVNRMLLDMNLWAHLKQRGYFAIWTTNRASCRDLVINLFDLWDFALVEEWIYLKVAADGQAVSQIDGMWRKPYEVLMIARSGQDSAQADSPVRRVIAAVPELHSRKPSLKGLFDRLLLPQNSGGGAKVLEVFARNLTAGWMSWGDEALKFNWDHNWV